jgi:CheY-like chemotaxis protein
MARTRTVSVMALPTRPLTALVCDSDPLVARTFGQCATDQGFEVADPTEHGPRLLERVDVVHPSLVIVTNELIGMTGMEVLDLLVKIEDGPEVILVTSDERALREGVGAGALAVADRFDLEGLEQAIGDAKFLFETGERRKVSDRRLGGERRQVQDWSKVISERRVSERRRGPRRSDEASPDAAEWTERRQKQDWNQVTVERRQGLPQRPKT